MRSKLAMFGAVLILIIGAAGTGYYVRAQQAAVQWEDRLLSNLTLYVTVHDAIESKRADDLRPILVSGLESDFYRMVLHRQDHGVAQAKDLQCALAKRVRKMRADKELFVDERRVSDSGIEIEIIDRYLATECLGEPARDSWMPAEES